MSPPATSTQSFTLNTGAKMPAIGLGTWRSEPGLVAKAVEEAIRAGYRHIDGAWFYHNESEVGEGIRNSGVPRSELFVTTKLWNTFHKPEDVSKAFEESLNNLGLDYVDMYLMHSALCIALPEKPYEVIPECDPQVDFVETYKAMEKLLETGKTKAIGVSNFSQANLERLLANTSVVPATNQVELHPYLPQPKLVEFCKANGILVTAYSPLGSTAEFNLRDDLVITEIAKARNATPSQVLLAWGVKRGTVVIPKSTNKERIIENFHLAGITDEDFAKINAITHRARFAEPGNFFGKPYQGMFGFEEA